MTGYDVMEMHSHFFLLATTPYVTIHIKELPVFKPNEYYWKNHSQEGKQRWQIYAETMRKILSDLDGYKLSDMAMEDKLVYRSMLKSFKKLEE